MDRVTCRDARRRGGKPMVEPFATLRPDLVCAAAVELPGPALKLWLLLEAAWRPPRKGQVSGRACVPHTVARRIGGPGLTSPNAVTDAFRLLRARGLIEQVQSPVRPSSRPSSRSVDPRAAEYKLVDRDGERWSPLPMPAGMRVTSGRLRLHVERIRYDVRTLSSTELRLMMLTVAQQHRDRFGAVVSLDPIRIDLDATAAWLGCTSVTIRRTRDALLRLGRLVQVEPAAGRRPPSYRLAATYLGHERRFPKSPKAEPSRPLSPVSDNAIAHAPQRGCRTLAITPMMAKKPTKSAFNPVARPPACRTPAIGHEEPCAPARRSGGTR